MLCPNCGKRMDTLADKVLTFVRESSQPVRPADVAERFGITPQSASATLCYLSDRSLIVRVRHGVYTDDRELARQMLLERLERLTPA